MALERTLVRFMERTSIERASMRNTSIEKASMRN